MWAGYIAVGLLAGVISGMGIGGGAILIPALTFFYGMGQQTAQNINLLYFIPTALIALITHKKNGNIEKKGLTGLIIFGLLGAALGAMIAIRIDAGLLRKAFGFFLLGMGTYECFRNTGRDRATQHTKHSV